MAHEQFVVIIQPHIGFYTGTSPMQGVEQRQASPIIVVRVTWQWQYIASRVRGIAQQAFGVLSPVWRLYIGFVIVPEKRLPSVDNYYKMYNSTIVRQYKFSLPAVANLTKIVQ